MGKMRKKAMARALGLLALLLCFPAQALALEASELVPGGDAVGIQLEAGGVIVAGFSEVHSTDGQTRRPAEDAGIKAGDVIREVGGIRVQSAADFLTAMSACDGEALLVRAARNGQELTFHVTPAKSGDGVWQLGLWLRDAVAGIGTVTFYDPDTGVFGALGHGINDLDTGALLPFETGTITAAEVVDVIPGAAGSPGELCGKFDREDIRGTLAKNTERGIFGTAAVAEPGAPIPVAGEDEVTLGPATIRSSVGAEGARDYAVEISRVYRDSEDNRFLLLTVTDAELLARTGGIVQGMSGSPILQNGKLIGAVTHVLLGDPRRGYGISIEKMLEAA